MLHACSMLFYESVCYEFPDVPSNYVALHALRQHHKYMHSLYFAHLGVEYVKSGNMLPHIPSFLFQSSDNMKTPG